MARIKRLEDNCNLKSRRRQQHSNESSVCWAFATKKKPRSRLVGVVSRRGMQHQNTPLIDNSAAAMTLRDSRRQRIRQLNAVSRRIQRTQSIKGVDGQNQRKSQRLAAGIEPSVPKSRQTERRSGRGGGRREMEDERSGDKWVNQAHTLNATGTWVGGLRDPARLQTVLKKSHTVSPPKTRNPLPSPVVWPGMKVAYQYCVPVGFMKPEEANQDNCFSESLNQS